MSYSPNERSSLLTSHPPVILQLRIFALYHLNKKVLVIMVVSFIAAVISSGTLMGMVLRDLSGEDPLSPKSRIDRCLNNLRSRARCRPVRHYHLCAYEHSRVLLHVLDPHLGLRDPPLRSRGLQGFPEYATQTITSLLRQGDHRRTPQRLCGVLHSVSWVGSRSDPYLINPAGCSRHML